MKAYEFKSYIYAENEEEVDALEDTLYKFVLDNKNEGRAITATKLVNLLNKAKNNPIMMNLL